LRGADGAHDLDRWLSSLPAINCSMLTTLAGGSGAVPNFRQLA